MRILVLTTAALLLATLAGCGGNPRRPVGDAEKLYEMAKKASDNGNYRDAITYYEQLEARFPFSNPARQICGCEQIIQPGDNQAGSFDLSDLGPQIAGKTRRPGIRHRPGILLENQGTQPLNLDRMQC